MKKYIPIISAAVLSVFGLLTLFLTTSVIFDLFGIRAKEGNFVLFVVWANFFAGFLYLIAAYGFMKAKKTTALFLSAATLILLAATVGLKAHADAGGLYETKTMSAMIFRVIFTFLFALISYFTINKTQMKTQFISMFAIALSLYGCGKTGEKSADQTDSLAKTEEVVEVADVPQTIELDNGQKWKINSEMMPPLRNMDKDVEVFVAAPTKDYKALGTELQKHIGMLTSSCTMKGKSHDELHKWLMPYIETVKLMTEAGDETVAAQKFTEVQAALVVFDQYFE